MSQVYNLKIYMNTLSKISLIIFTSLLAFNITNAVEVSTNVLKTHSCAWANESRIIYITWDSIFSNVLDYIKSPWEKYVWDDSSKVWIWTSDPNLLSWCNTWWQRVSSLSPGSNKEVLALLWNCTFNKPTNNNKRKLQFVFNVANYDILSWNGIYVWNYNLWYYSDITEVNNWTIHDKSYTNVWFGNFDQWLNECLNVELRYCWDGIVSNWEVCDDGNNIDWDGCNSTCTMVTWPICWDGIIQSPETCDDWNTIDWDGCSSTCQLPTLPWTCVAWVTWTQNTPLSSTNPNLCSDNSQSVVYFTSTVNGNTTNYNWWCSDGTVIHTWWSCNADYTISVPPNSSSSSWGWSSSSSWGWSSSSSWGWWNYCWDWRVERPNSNLEMEECDMWSQSDWWFCNNDCTYSTITIPWTCDPSVSTCDITIPWGWTISFWINDNVIIWAWMNPYTAHNLWKPYIQNTSNYDFYFDELCVVKKDGNSIIWSDYCENLWLIEAGWIKYLSIIPDFVWAKITTWNYWDNTLITTIKHDGFRYDNAYFISKLKVRVAKSSVVTTGWWTSYLSSSNNVWNISKISNNWNLDPDKNKNFVWVGVSNWDATSYSKEINDTSSVNTVASEWDVLNENISNVTDISGTAYGDTTTLSDFEIYNWIKNVFILKNTNFKINNDLFSWLHWARTYIIENWDLEINTNITFSDNIAFVVKWWNILIDKNVDTIDWTYITIEKDGNGWNFKWINWDTTNRLLVNWSLYWNIDDLISHRTYVKQNSFNQIDVWTIVSFGSSLFRKTAPLLSSFIDEYQNAIKIAQ